MPRGTKFPQEMRERAVRMVAEIGEPGAIIRLLRYRCRRARSSLKRLSDFARPLLSALGDSQGDAVVWV